jgi:Ca2+-binding EF-hand superfamily protein
MRQLLLVLGALALIFVAGYVMAQDERMAPEDRDTQLRLARMDTSVAAFRRLDKDSDGRISALEAADNPKVAAAFTMADKDKDGYLSKEEFAAISSTSPHSSVDASSPSGDQPASSPSEDQHASSPSGDQPTQPPRP